MAVSNNVVKFEQFDENAESFSDYKYRLECHLEANNVSEAVKGKQFVSIMGANLFKKLKNIAFPTKIQDLGFKEMIEFLETHFKKPTNTVYARYRFNTICRQSNEEISCFVIRLKQAATECEFGNFLDEALRDRFVAGINDETVLKRLLSESKLEFKKATELAETMTGATRTAGVISDRNINIVAAKNTLKQAQKNAHKNERCYHCGKSHNSEVCWFKKSESRNCRKIGHIAAICRYNSSKKFGKAEMKATNAKIGNINI